jgi:hypothetical protein
VQTDAELVKAVLNGEKHVFAELVKRYERPVRAIALDILGDNHSAADARLIRFGENRKKLCWTQKSAWRLKIRTAGLTKTNNSF